MYLENIECKCPKCNFIFQLEHGIDDDNLKKLSENINILQNKEVQNKIRSEKERALNEGKKIADEELLNQLKKIQTELEDKHEEIKNYKLEKLDINKEINKIKRDQEQNLKAQLYKERQLWEVLKDDAERKLKLKIEQLTNDLQDVTKRAKKESTQLQGEASELNIEDTLKNAFPYDEVSEIKKGQSGADCLLIIKKNDVPVGKILIESKNTKYFKSEWLQKLKNDTLEAGAQLSVLVTMALPSNSKKAHIRNGIWVCQFHEYLLLIKALRESVINISKIKSSEIARDTKANVMYDFLTSNEFSQTIERMISPILRMEEQLKKEKRAMQNLWKQRETLIEGSISGANILFGKIQGIAQVNLPSSLNYNKLEYSSHEESTKKKNQIKLQDKDKDIYNKLKDRRNRLASERGLPPYTILINKTLIEMAIIKPKNLIEMKNITGMGPKKIEQYGLSFLDLLNEILARES